MFYTCYEEIATLQQRSYETISKSLGLTHMLRLQRTFLWHSAMLGAKRLGWQISPQKGIYLSPRSYLNATERLDHAAKPLGLVHVCFCMVYHFSTCESMTSVF